MAESSVALPTDAVDVPHASAGGLPPDAVDVQAPAEPSWMDKAVHMMGNAWQQLNPVSQVQGAADTATRLFQHPIDTIAAIGRSNDQPRVDAEKAFKEGRYAEGVRHVLEYGLNAIPGLGNAAEKGGNEAQSGDVAGGVGTALGVAGNLVAPAIAPKMATAAGKATKAVLERPVTEGLGAATGVGGAPLRRALENPTPELTDAMRGGMTERDLLKEFQNSVQDFRDMRGAQYRQQLAQLPAGKGSSIDISPIKRAVDTQLQKFNIKPAANGALDFSRSSVGDAAAQNVIQQTFDDVKDWGTQAGDRTPIGVDTLVRRVADRYSPNSNARAFIQAVKDTGSKTIGSQVPGYATMKSSYAQASQFLDEMKDLSLESANPGTAIRKLTTTLRQNNAWRQALVDQLGDYTGKDLTGMLAGMNLNPAAPQGLARLMDLGTGSGLLFGVATHKVPAAMAVSLAASSPRLMGELMVAMSKAKNVSAAAGAVGPANLAERALTSGQTQ